MSKTFETFELNSQRYVVVDLNKTSRKDPRINSDLLKMCFSLGNPGLLKYEDLSKLLSKNFN